VQRAKRRGKPNLWVVVTIKDAYIKKNLLQVQTDLENRYKKHRSELRKGFTDLTSDLVHITLFGMHANKARILQVQNALTNYQELIHKHNMNGVFDIELKGLGSWTTQSGCVCLYADLTKESAVKIKTLAKEMRDFVNTSLVDNIENIHLIELKKSQLQTNQDEPVLNNEEDDNSTDDDFDIPKNNNREIHLNENNPKENTHIIYSEESSSDEEEEDPEEEDVKGEEDQITGFWIDDPKPEIYIPHVTLLKTDPKWDKKLRNTLNDGKGKPGKREKTGKHGAVKVKEIKTTREPFGWSYSLYREIRSQYSTTTFGVQRVDRIELQSDFKTITNVFLPNQ
jgi:hypothetical protein